MNSPFVCGLLLNGAIMLIIAIFLTAMYYLCLFLKNIPRILQIIIFRIKFRMKGLEIKIHLNAVLWEIEEKDIMHKLSKRELKELHDLFEETDCFISMNERFLGKKTLNQLHILQGRISSEYEKHGGNLIAPLKVNGL